MTLAHRSLQLRIARVGEKGPREGRGWRPRVVGREKVCVSWACPQILRAPVFPPVSAPLVASSVSTTLQVRKGYGFGVEERLEGGKLSCCI